MYSLTKKEYEEKKANTENQLTPEVSQVNH
jgi:hypothetical protein